MPGWCVMAWSKLDFFTLLPQLFDNDNKLLYLKKTQIGVVI